MQRETMLQESYRGDASQKIAGIALIAGGILTLVFNVIFPRADDPNVMTQVLQALARNEALSILVYLGIAVGVWAIMIGIAGISHNITDGAGAAWARMGFYGVILGTSLLTVFSGIGIESVGAAVDWVASGSTDATALGVAAALNLSSSAAFNMTILFNWLGMAFVGIGLVLSDSYPKWLGWVLLVISVVLVIISVSRFFYDTTQITEILFAAPAALTSVWAVVMGIWITNKEIKSM